MLRDDDLQPLPFRIADEVHKGLAIIFSNWRIHTTDSTRIKSSRKTTNMILVRMCSNHVVNSLNAKRIRQIRVYIPAIADIPAVYHQRLTIALDNGSICLTYIEEADNQLCAAA